MDMVAGLHRSEESKRFARFLAVGVLNTAVGYALFAATIYLGFGPFWGAVVSTAIGVLFNFRSIGWIVFRRSELTLLPRFLSVYVAQCAVNIAGLHVLTGWGLSPLLAQLMLVPFLATGTYLAMRSFVFRDK